MATKEPDPEPLNLAGEGQSGVRSAAGPGRTALRALPISGQMWTPTASAAPVPVDTAAAEPVDGVLLVTVPIAAAVAPQTLARIVKAAQHGALRTLCAVAPQAVQRIDLEALAAAAATAGGGYDYWVMDKATGTVTLWFYGNPVRVEHAIALLLRGVEIRGVKRWYSDGRSDDTTTLYGASPVA